jgi:hypothetical protein
VLRRRLETESLLSSSKDNVIKELRLTIEASRRDIFQWEERFYELRNSCRLIQGDLDVTSCDFERYAVVEPAKDESRFLFFTFSSFFSPCLGVWYRFKLSQSAFYKRSQNFLGWMIRNQKLGSSSLLSRYSPLNPNPCFSLCMCSHVFLFLCLTSDGSHSSHAESNDGTRSILER